MHWYDTWFDKERYEYLINWLSRQTMILSFPTPLHPAYMALLALAKTKPEVIVPYFMEELGHKHKWSDPERGSKYRAAWAIMSILWEAIPDAPVIPENKRGRFVALLDLWLKWYKKHLKINEHNAEEYVHVLGANA